MPLLKQRRVMAAKLEVTPGTAVSLTGGTDGMINAYDVVIDGDISYNERMVAGQFGRQAGVTGTKAGSLKFKMEGYGSGTGGAAPAWALVLLEACAMSHTAGVFTPISAAASQNAATIGVYEDGILKKLAGAMGDWTWTGEDGKIGVFEFDFKGVWVDPTDVALIANQYSAVIPPVFAGATLTIGSYAPTLSKLAIKLGNKIELRQDATKAAGYIAAINTDRKTTGSLDPEAVTIATYDAWGIFKAGTTAALSCALTGGTGAGYTIACPAVQYEKIAEGDRNGIVTHNLDFVSVFDGTNADKEVTITF